MIVKITRLFWHSWDSKNGWQVEFSNGLKAKIISMEIISFLTKLIVENMSFADRTFKVKLNDTQLDIVLEKIILAV